MNVKGQDNIKNKNRKATELLLFLLLLLPLIAMSYTHIEESVSVIKYNIHKDTDKLIQNYHLHHSSFKGFLLKTSSFHQGDCNSGWDTAYYLLPLFIFLKIVGGLSLRNLYLFTITTSIISLFLFFYWVRKYWNKEIAFFATFLWGYSAVFQEFARSGSYINYSILIALVWIIVMYLCLETKKLTPYLFLGILTGVAMYGYGMLRGLIFIPIYILFRRPDFSGVSLGIPIETSGYASGQGPVLAGPQAACPERNRGINPAGTSFSRKDIYKKRWFLFLAGCLVFILPGVILKINRAFTGLNDKFPYLFFDQQHIFKGLFLKEFQRNIQYFFNRILGGPQVIPNLCANNYHAHYLNRILTIPFFVGLLQAIRYRKEQKYRLFLLLSFFVFLVPIFTCSVREARRSVLYVIPIYLYIGIGTETIFNFVRSIKNRIVRQISFWGVICAILFIISSEALYVKSFILNSNRDVGVLAFARGIKEKVAIGDIYYFEPYRKDNPQFKIYRFTDLAVLRLALMGNKNNNLALINIKDLEEVDKGLKDFYVIIKSYVISEDEFQELCQNYNLYPQRLAVCNLKNFGLLQRIRNDFTLLKDFSLKLFKVSRQ